MEPDSTITQVPTPHSDRRDPIGPQGADPVAQQERLARILDDYLVAIEQGQHITPDDLLAKYPQDALQLRGYLSGLNLFHAAAIDPSKSLLKSSEPDIGIPPALRTIGDYRLVREIGHGGMGVVYEAWQVSLRRRVALKVLPFTSSRDTKQIGRFKNEAQAAAQVQHPNIVPVFAVGEENGVHYYVMQLIDGQSLTSLLAALHTRTGAPCGTMAGNNALTYNTQRAAAYLDPTPRPAIEKSLPMRAGETADHIRVVARLGVEAAEALHAAHEYGVVHRDVKPSNLLLDDQGKLWVTDFGLARCRDEQGLTQTGDILGTMRYMSPEQARGNTALVDHRTDIYSLGLTLYELATLNHPADEGGEAQILERDRPAPKPLRHWNRHIPYDFQTIVLKCLAEHPFERYPSAKELAEDLQRYLDGRPILASPPSVISRLGKWAKRHRGVVYATAAVLIVAAVASVIISHEQSAANERALELARNNWREQNAMLTLFNTRYARALSGIPGTEAIAHDMLQSGLEYNERFVRETGNDPLFAADAALAYTNLGSLNNELGNQAAALDAYTKAKAAYENFLQREPDHAELSDQLAQTLGGLAMLKVSDGHLNDARDLLSRAAELQSNLVAGEPLSEEFVTHLATTHNNLGLVNLKLRSTNMAAQQFRTAIELQEPLSKKPDNEETRRNLAASYNNLASLIKHSDPAAAAALYQKAIALERDLVKISPTNRKHQAELALAYNNLGFVAAAGNDWKKAEACYMNAIELQSNLVKLSPQIVSFRSDLAVSYINLGMAQSRASRLAEADASFHQAVELHSELLKNKPNDAELLSNQGGAWNNIGMLRDRQNQPAAAAHAYQQAITFQLAAIQQGRDNETYRDLLSRHYFNYARNLAAQSKFDDSLKITDERKRLWPGNAERLFAVARELADLQHQMTTKPGTEQTRTAAAQAAVAALREALAAGLPAERLNDAPLSVLSDSPEFQQLLSDEKISRTAPVSTTPVELSRVN